MNIYARAALKTLQALFFIALGVVAVQIVAAYPLAGMIAAMVFCVGILYWINLDGIRRQQDIDRLDRELAQRRQELEQKA